MRDDRHKWAAFAPDDTAIDLGGAQLSPIRLARQTLISGPNVHAQTSLPVIEWPDIIDQDVYALSLRRDRVLVVNGPEIETGWTPGTSQAISDASDAYATFDLSGPGAFQLLQRGAELSLKTRSKSVMRALFGMHVMLYRRASERFRLHVPTAQQDGLMHHIKAAAQHLR